MNISELFLRLSEIEGLGADLYVTFSKQCSDRLRSTAVLLAKEEMKHKKMILEVSLNTEIKEKIISEDVNFAVQKQINYIDIEGSSVDLSSEKAFFRFALELERNSTEIYQRLMEMLKNDLYEHSKIETIYGEEKNHMVYVLNKLYELK